MTYNPLRFVLAILRSSISLYILRLIENNIIDGLVVKVIGILEKLLFCCATFTFESLQIDEKIENSTKNVSIHLYTQKFNEPWRVLVKSFVFEALNFYLKMAYIYMTKTVQVKKIWIINLTLWNKCPLHKEPNITYTYYTSLELKAIQNISSLNLTRYLILLMEHKIMI